MERTQRDQLALQKLGQIVPPRAVKLEVLGAAGDVLPGSEITKPAILGEPWSERNQEAVHRQCYRNVGQSFSACRVQLNS